MILYLFGRLRSWAEKFSDVFSTFFEPVFGPLQCKQRCCVAVPSKSDRSCSKIVSFENSPLKTICTGAHHVHIPCRKQTRASGRCTHAPPSLSLSLCALSLSLWANPPPQRTHTWLFLSDLCGSHAPLCWACLSRTKPVMCSSHLTYIYVGTRTFIYI